VSTERRIRVVVVDDEAPARDAVLALLANAADVDVVATAADGREALEMIRRERPDLVFLDVQMPDLDGFDVVRGLDPEALPEIIFVTAHDEHALTAFEVCALDYLLKPFGAKRFGFALDRARDRLAEQQPSRVLRALEDLLAREAMSADDAVRMRHARSAQRDGIREESDGARIAVRVGSRVLMVEEARVDWVEADGDYVRLHVGRETYLLSARLGDLEERLGPAFVRTHRSALVRVARIRELRRTSSGSGVVILDGDAEVRVARSRWSVVENALGIP